MIRLVEVYESSTKWQMLFDLAQSESLHNYLEDKALSLSSCKDILKGLTLALQHSHSLNYAHCNVQPKNIFLR